MRTDQILGGTMCQRNRKDQEIRDNMYSSAEAVGAWLYSLFSLS